MFNFRFWARNICIDLGIDLGIDSFSATLPEATTERTESSDVGMDLGLMDCATDPPKPQSKDRQCKHIEATPRKRRKVNVDVDNCSPDPAKAPRQRRRIGVP